MAEAENPGAPAGDAQAAAQVFISYASQDKAMADAVCRALEQAGVACWIAPRDVVPGESYSGAIVRAIDAATVAVLVLSESAAASPHVLREIERATARRRPVVSFRIDFASMTADLEYFLNTSQWLDAATMGTEQALPRLVAGVQHLLADPSHVPSAPDPKAPAPVAEISRFRTAAAPAGISLRSLLIAMGAVTGIALGYIAVDQIRHSTRGMADNRVTPTVPAAPSFNPPPRSIAVLPFVNMSGDKDQEYFSDGLTEEMLNSLSRISELQVAARTSAFSFKGKDVDIGTIGRALNVGAVLEGSVRRSAHTVRITAQLINAVTGFHMWSQTYDRDLGDVLGLQTEIANSVASVLKVTLLEDVAATIELGGTHDPAAFDAYLRGSTAVLKHDAQSLQAAIAAYSEAIRLDPNYALAFAHRSFVLASFAEEFETGRPAQIADFDRAQADARRTIALAPDLAEGHRALATVFDTGTLDFTRASEEYERAMALAPGNAELLGFYGRFAVYMGRTEAGIAAARHAVVVDPLNPRSRRNLLQALFAAHRYEETLAVFQDLLLLSRDDPRIYGYPGLAHFALGHFENARAICEIKPGYWLNQLCLAVVYDRLGRRLDAQHRARPDTRLVGRCGRVPICRDLCPMGRCRQGAGLPRHGAASPGFGPGVFEDRPDA